MGRRIYLDTEGNGLYPEVTKLWCAVAKDVDSGELFKFHPKERTACSDCSGTGHTKGVFLCDTCEGAGELIAGDHTEWKEDFEKLLDETDIVIGHNLIGYDNLAIKKVLDLDIPLSKTVDTLVMSRLFRPVTPPGGAIAGGTKDPDKPNYVDNRLGGHGLEAYGKRLGFPKQDFDDWSKYQPKMLEYCINDVELGIRIWRYLEEERLGLKDPAYLTGDIKEPVPFSELSIKAEHTTAYYLRQQELNGFKLDKQAATELRDLTGKLLDEMNTELHKHFPPVEKFVKEWEPKLTKAGALNKSSKRIIKDWICKPATVGYLTDSEGTQYHSKYNLYEMQEFNPRSGQQVAARLQSLGWKPKNFTPKGAPATDKNSLKDAVNSLKDAHPEVAFLENYEIVAYNHDKANKWLDIVQDDGRVHGRINHMGAGTHRCTHSDDNMANIASVKKGAGGEVLKGLDGQFGWDCRRCWSVDEGNVLVGADASGIQLRALAHYMNDPTYTNHLLKGDIHVVNQRAAGIQDRPTAKTFIYAWLLGAGDEKIGDIVSVSPEEITPLLRYGMNEKKYGKPLCQYFSDSLRKVGRKATKEVVAKCVKGYKTKKQFLDRTPALKRLREKDIPAATKQGYLVGLDGRKLWIPSEHLAMSLYLQGFEAVIMKTAIAYFHRELMQREVPFKQVAFVHDEVQIECAPEHAELVGKAVVRGIQRAGNLYKVNCPLDGEYQIGANWAETH
jgi:DNA polymerase-1